MKIKHKLLASFLVATLVPVLVVALFTIRNVTEEAKVQFQESSSLDITSRWCPGCQGAEERKLYKE